MTPASGSKTPARPTLVLDLDGTLVDTAGDLVATLNIILDRQGLPPVAFNKAREMIGDGARAMLQAGLAAQGNAPDPDRLDALFEDFVDHYTRHIADLSAPFPGALTALDRFAAEGWLLAICTNKLENLARDLLGQIGISGRFAAIAGQDTFGVRKPDPRHITETVLSAGGDMGAAIMVGDSEPDIAAAQAANIPSIGVSFGYCPVDIATFGPNHIIDHFDQLFDAAERLVRR